MFADFNGKLFLSRLSRGSSNHEIVLIFLNAVIMISFLQIPPSKNFQIHKVLSHQLFPSPILFISSSAFFIFYLSRLHLHFFSFFTLFSVHHVLVYSFRPLRPLFPHSLLSFSLSEVTSEATIMLLAINTPPSLLLSNRGSFFLALIL